MSRRRAGWALPAPGTRPSRRPLPPGGVEGAIPMTFGMLAERPGSQLDLVAEAGTEVIGPSTLAPHAKEYTP